MEHTIDYRPTFSLLTLTLERDEQVVAEAGALASHEPGIEIETGARGGVFGALRRKFGGQSFFVNTFSAEQRADVAFAPPFPGDVVRHDLSGEPLVVSSGSYLASARDVDIDTRWGGRRTFFGGEGLFMLELSGHGPVFLSSYGAVHRVDLAAGETYTVDTGHLVAFEERVTFDVRTVGGLKSTLFSGEGLVSEFTGPGTLWLQTRSVDAFLAWLVPKLPAVSRGGSVEYNADFGRGP